MMFNDINIVCPGYITLHSTQCLLGICNLLVQVQNAVLASRAVCELAMTQGHAAVI